MNYIERAKKVNQRFCEIFGTRLSPMMNSLTGFDICEFDRRIGSNGSLKQHILQRYGQEALNIIEFLLKVEVQDG